ncbi:hypothetical protein K7432_004732 [Basidiobolus ranarum]|uniref:Peptidase M15C domain-containing protein n=1 Tax=Basidiobolus ranarum TaxID=34480 RepID=A0ABR2W453_9FUNG
MQLTRIVLAFFALAAVGAQDFGSLKPIPNLNQGGLKYCPPSTLLSILGKPCTLKADCSPVTNEKIKKLTITGRVGHIGLTGIKPAVEAAIRALTKVQKENPALFKVIKSAGMLCCRLIRNSKTEASNHSWGTAVDFSINDVLDPRGDGKAQLGLHTLYPYFHAEGFYWGAGFSGASEDAMHFEVADQTIRRWQQEGKLSA